MSLLDTPVAEAEWAAIDFESTGSAPGQGDEPVQIGIAVARGEMLAPENFFRSFVRPDARLTQAASAVHRIRQCDVENAPPLVSLWPEIKERLSGAVILAHGAGTERRFLRAFPMHGFGPWVDTLVLARAFLPGLPDHSLASVVGACGAEGALRDACPGLDWHDALFDATACLVILRHFVEAFGLGSHAVGELASPDGTAYHRIRRLVRTVRDAGITTPGE